MKMMQFVAVCGYPGLDTFHYFSPTFEVVDWSDLEKVGQAKVKEAWELISPHPAPEILRFEPGGLFHLAPQEAEELRVATRRYLTET